jgi:type IV secretory pathway TrbF-like protein
MMTNNDGCLYALAHFTGVCWNFMAFSVLILVDFPALRAVYLTVISNTIPETVKGERLLSVINLTFAKKKKKKKNFN